MNNKPTQQDADKVGAQPSDDFWKWLHQAYGTRPMAYTAWNMEVAYVAGKRSAQPDEPSRGEPVAFAYELGARLIDGEYSIWSPRLTFGMPNVPDGSIRNLTWLYAHPQPADPDVKESLTTAEPTKHPSYDTDCCHGHNPEPECKCVKFDAQPDPAMAGDEWLKQLVLMVGQGYPIEEIIIHASKRVQPASGEVKPQPHHLKTPHQNYLVFQGDKQVKDFGNHFYSEVEAHEFVTRKNKEILGDNF